MPGKDGTTSVFRIGGLKRREVAAIGAREVGAKRSVHGWAVVAAHAVNESGLRFDANDAPPRHADIVGWPDDQDARLERAQELVAKAWRLDLTT
jgi:hypothetical protein